MVDQTDFDIVGFVLGVAMCNGSQVAGLDTGSNAACFLLGLTDKIAVDICFCTGRQQIHQAGFHAR